MPGIVRSEIVCAIQQPRLLARLPNRRLLFQLTAADYLRSTSNSQLHRQTAQTPQLSFLRAFCSFGTYQI